MSLVIREMRDADADAVAGLVRGLARFIGVDFVPTAAGDSRPSAVGAGPEPNAANSSGRRDRTWSAASSATAMATRSSSAGEAAVSERWDWVEFTTTMSAHRHTGHSGRAHIGAPGTEHPARSSRYR